MTQQGMFGDEDDPPESLLPKEGSLGAEKQCQFCPVQVRFGLTNKGNRAPFDVTSPHVNHWSTCEGRREARKTFDRGSRHPQSPRRRR